MSCGGGSPIDVGETGSGVTPRYGPVMHAAVDLHIGAEPEVVWGLISDITNMGRWSPEVFEAEWLGGATGPAVGVRYRGHVKRNEKGPIYWTECEITECVPGEVFEFAVMIRDTRVNTWRFEFAADGDGTRVTESFRLIDNVAMKAFRLFGGFLRQRRNERDMLTTLERVKAAAEAS